MYKFFIIMGICLAVYLIFDYLEFFVDDEYTIKVFRVKAIASYIVFLFSLIGMFISKETFDFLFTFSMVMSIFWLVRSILDKYYLESEKKYIKSLEENLEDKDEENSKKQ